MGDRLFTQKEIDQLTGNAYVKVVSNKSVAYIKEFKCLFIIENGQGKSPQEIFKFCGFDIEANRH